MTRRCSRRFEQTTRFTRRPRRTPQRTCEPRPLRLVAQRQRHCARCSPATSARRPLRHVKILRRAHPTPLAFQVPEGLLRGQLARSTSDHLLDRDPDLVHLPHLLDPRRTRHQTPRDVSLDMTIALEHAQCLTHRSPARREPLGKSLLEQAAVAQSAEQQIAAKRDVDLLGPRVGHPSRGDCIQAGVHACACYDARLLYLYGPIGGIKLPRYGPSGELKPVGLS